LLKYKYSKLDKLPNDAGIDLDNWLLYKYKYSNFDKFPNDAGIDPDNWLLFKYKYFNFDKFPNDAGIVPDNSLLYKYKYSKLDKFPNDAGINPDNWLWYKYNNVKLDKFPNDAGIVPIKPFAINAISTTAFFSEEQLTPCHWQGLEFVLKIGHVITQFDPFVAWYTLNNVSIWASGRLPTYDVAFVTNLKTIRRMRTIFLKFIWTNSVYSDELLYNNNNINGEKLAKKKKRGRRERKINENERAFIVCDCDCDNVCVLVWCVSCVWNCVFLCVCLCVLCVYVCLVCA
jgi:hypothetical protein